VLKKHTQKIFIISFFLLFQSTLSFESSLRVTKTVPESDATNVFADSPVTVTFSKPIAPGSVDRNSFAVFGDKSGRIDGAITFNGTYSSATFTPSKPFIVGDRILAVLSHSVQSADGDNLNHGFSWVFDVRSPKGSVNFIQ
jgi:hypothetical protein